MHSIEPTVHSIIFNLIDNAIKYTPHQGVINISVYTDQITTHVFKLKIAVQE